MIIDDKEISEKLSECIYEFMETTNDEEKYLKYIQNLNYEI